MSGDNHHERSVSGTASDIKLFLKGKAAVVQKPTTSNTPFIPRPNIAGINNNVGIKVLNATTINQNVEVFNKNAHKIQLSVTQRKMPIAMEKKETPGQNQVWYPAGIPRSFLRDSNYPAPAAPSPMVNMMYNRIGQYTLNASEAPPPHMGGADVSEDVGDTSPDDDDDGSESPGQKRRSAFQRLGPVTQTKKPKLTINLLFSKEQSVREVVNEETPPQPPVHVPVPNREDILSSTNEVVLKYLACWPWKQPIAERRKAIYRDSKSAMLMEKREMLKVYGLNQTFFKVIITGYPPNSTKEEVIDIVLDSIKGKTMIPCFIEFTPTSCCFLVIRSIVALEALHNNSLCVKRDNCVLHISIVHLDLTLSHIDFIPKLILRKLVKDRCKEKELDLSGFCLEYDVSHFLYYPLNRLCNQADLLPTHTPVACDTLHTLNLSGNRLTGIDGFNLVVHTPNLKRLDLSNNLLEKVTLLLHYRNLPLQSLNLENNPLCYDFLDPTYYVRVLRMMFPTLKEIDGVRIARGGELPSPIQNYCPLDAAPVVERFLEVFFQILDSRDTRKSMVDLYDAAAIFSLTYDYKLRSTATFRQFRDMFSRARIVEEAVLDCVEGSSAIVKCLTRWPPLLHDPTTFYVDVLHHDDKKTVFNVNGLVKLISESSPDDVHVLKFTRTVVLRAQSDAQYKILHELLSIQEPKCVSETENAFDSDVLAARRFDTKLQNPINQEIKDKLIEVFGKLTKAKPQESESCLAIKDWDLGSALEYFAQLVANDDLHTLNQNNIQTNIGNYGQVVQ